MKYLWSCAIAVALFTALSAVAPAAEPSPGALAKWGLGGMRVMSDQEGQAVRGNYVLVFGSAWGSKNGVPVAGTAVTLPIPGGFVRYTFVIVK